MRCHRLCSRPGEKSQCEPEQHVARRRGCAGGNRVVVGRGRGADGSSTHPGVEAAGERHGAEEREHPDRVADRVGDQRHRHQFGRRIDGIADGDEVRRSPHPAGADRCQPPPGLGRQPRPPDGPGDHDAAQDRCCRAGEGDEHPRAECGHRSQVAPHHQREDQRRHQRGENYVLHGDDLRRRPPAPGDRKGGGNHVGEHDRRHHLEEPQRHAGRQRREQARHQQEDRGKQGG